MVRNQYRTAKRPVFSAARRVNAEGLEYIKRWEGLHLSAYLCAGGSWTIGYGHTNAAGAPVVTKGMVIDKARAETMLQQDLRQYEAAVNAVSSTLTDNQFSALVSFAYNVGTETFNKSRIPALVKSGQLHAVPAELMRYVYAKGKKLSGLVNRRAAESGLWVKGNFVSSAYQTADLKRGYFMAPEVMAPVVGSCAGLAGFANGSGPFQWALAFVMVLCALGGAWYFICRHRR